jgi:hypothetical protein
MITGSENVEGESVARVFYPGATAVTLIGRDGQKTALIKVHADGLFETAVPDSFPINPDEYTVEAVFSDGRSHSYSDPYAFAPTLVFNIAPRHRRRCVPRHPLRRRFRRR